MRGPKRRGSAMKHRKGLKGRTTVCTLISVLLLVVEAGAELKPGDVLDQTHWQEAQGLMPDAVLHRFETGQHLSKIIEPPPEALRWSTRFNAATEANLGKYDINDQGVMIEKATGTWPRVGYGMPFAQIDPQDPKAPYKIMYNFSSTLVQWDDISVLGCSGMISVYSSISSGRLLVAWTATWTSVGKPSGMPRGGRARSPIPTRCSPRC